MLFDDDADLGAFSGIIRTAGKAAWHDIFLSYSTICNPAPTGTHDERERVRAYRWHA